MVTLGGEEEGTKLFGMRGGGGEEHVINKLEITLEN